MRRVVGPILAMAVVAVTAWVLAGVPAASAAPSPSLALERLATSSSSPKALRAEARLRRLETRALGPGHAAEHAGVRAKIRRVKAARRRAGLRPALPRSSARRRAGQRALALGDPAQVGRWGPTTSVPAVAVHAILLPTGKLMFVQQDANGGVAYIWDPATGQGHRADPPANVWCGGQVFLADGRLLFIGGTLSFNGGENYSGLNHLYIFDPVTEAWTRQVDMRRGRWYPTGTRLPDGRVLITSGWDETGTMTMNGDVEIFTPGGTTGSIQRVADRQTQFYPHWQVLPDGRAFLGGPGRSNSAFLDLSTYAFADQAPLPESRVGYGGGVLLPGPPSGATKMFVAGGGGTPNTHRFDVLNPSAGWSNAAPLPQTRRNLNTVLLPDGTLLAVGGNGSRHRGPAPARDAAVLAGGGHLDASGRAERAARLPLDGAPAPRRARLVGRRQHRIRRRQRRRHRRDLRAALPVPRTASVDRRGADAAGLRGVVLDPGRGVPDARRPDEPGRHHPRQRHEPAPRRAGRDADRGRTQRRPPRPTRTSRRPATTCSSC